MRTVTPKPFTVYEFDELSDEAKQKAIEGQRDFEMEIGNPWSAEWEDTLHKIEELFDISVDFDSYNRHSISWRKWWSKEYGEELLELTGNRALSFLWNNYGNDITSLKFYWKGGIHDKSRHSRFQRESWNCPLTGVCYDNDALAPMWRFLEGKSPDENPMVIQHQFKYRFENWTVKDIIEDCVDSLCDAWDKEEEYRLSDEGLIESIKSNGYEYYEDGTLYAELKHGEVA